MGEDVGRRPLPGHAGQPRWRAERGQGGADLALGEVEALPDTQPGPIAALGGGAEGGGEAIGGSVLEEAPERVGGQAEASDLVGEPEGEGTTAAVSCLAVAAKDASCPDGPALRGVVKAVKEAVANEVADAFAVGTGDELELLGESVPLVGTGKKPAQRVHGCLGRKRRLYGGGEAG